MPRQTQEHIHTSYTLKRNQLEERQVELNTGNTLNSELKSLSEKIRQYRAGVGARDKSRYNPHSMKNRLELSPDGKIVADTDLSFFDAHEQVWDQALNIMQKFAGLTEFTELPHNESEPMVRLRRLEEWCYANIQRAHADEHFNLSNAGDTLANKKATGAGRGKKTEDLPAGTSKGKKDKTVKKPSRPQIIAWESYKWVIQNRPDLFELIQKKNEADKSKSKPRWYSKEMYEYVKENAPFYDNHPTDPTPIVCYGSWGRNLRFYEQWRCSCKDSKPEDSDQPATAVRREDVQDEDLSKLSARFDIDN